MLHKEEKAWKMIGMSGGYRVKSVFRSWDRGPKWFLQEPVFLTNLFSLFHIGLVQTPHASKITSLSSRPKSFYVQTRWKWRMTVSEQSSQESVLIGSDWSCAHFWIKLGRWQRSDYPRRNQGITLDSQVGPILRATKVKSEGRQGLQWNGEWMLANISNGCPLHLLSTFIPKCL